MSIKRNIERIIDRGIAFDSKEQYTAAYATYQEALRLIREAINDPVDESTANYMRTTLNDYTKRLDVIQTHMVQKKASDQFHERYHIEDKSIGNSYNSLFGRFLDDEVQFVIIEDPNVQNYFQFQNFLKFCELFINKCLNLKYMRLITLKNTAFEAEQRRYFVNLAKDLIKRKVKFYLRFVDPFSDMKFTLNSGWIIKINRGLDIYKPWDNIFNIGACDLDLRPCYETVIDIYHTKKHGPTIPLRHAHRS